MHFFKKTHAFLTQKPTNKKVEYFSISLKRLVFFSFLSAGLYQLYWAYQNWKALKKATKRPITPLFRSWFFFVYWIFPLLNQIGKDCLTNKKGKPLFYICVFLYVLLTILNIFIAKLLSGNWDIIYILVLSTTFATVFGSFFITSLLLLPVQKSINEYRQHQEKTHTVRHKISIGEIITVLVGFVLIYGNSFYAFQKEKAGHLTWEENNQVNFIIGSTYYNTLGYQSFCAVNGYKLTKYPDIFLETIKSDLTELDTKLSKHNISLQSLVDAFEKNTHTAVQEQIRQELGTFKQTLILEGISQEKKIPIQEVVWEDSFENLISFQEVCQILDEDASTFIQDNDELFEAIHKSVQDIR